MIEKETASLKLMYIKWVNTILLVFFTTDTAKYSYYTHPMFEGVTLLYIRPRSKE